MEFPRLEWTYPDGQAEVDAKNIHVFTDSDWAGRIRTQKSTNEKLATFAGVSLQHWRSTQTVFALSSGEAEFVALVRADAEGMAVQALALDLGLNLGLVVQVDSEAATATASRSGIGRVCHLEVKTLCVQAALREGRLALKKCRAPKTRRTS